MSQKIDISIISSGANLADARLHRLTNALLGAGLSVEIFAPGNLNDAPRAIANESSTSTTPELIVHATRGKFLSSKNLLARYHHSRIYSLRARGRIFYAISPEAVAPAFFQAKLLRRKFAVDFYEDYVHVLKDRGWAKKYFGILGFIALMDAKAARALSKIADLTTVADVQVPPFVAGNRLVVRNLPDESLLTQSGNRSAKPRAIYIGDIRTSRGLRTMLKAAELAPDWEFDFVGPVAEADRDFVENWIVKNVSHNSANSSSPRIRFHGKLAPRDAWKFAEGAWVGLSLLENTPAFVEAIPSKLYEYMAVGVAIISSPLPRCVELINKSGAGTIAASAEDVAAQLNAWSMQVSDLQGLKNEASDLHNLVPNRDDEASEIDRIRSTAKRWAEQNLDSDAEYGNFAANMRKILN